MIVGGTKKPVIKNIKKNIKDNELNKKVEVGDPVLSEEETDKILNNFYSFRKNKLAYFFRSRFAYQFIDILSFKLNHSIEIDGLEKLDDNLKNGIVTSNHFNPLDNMVVRKAIKKKYHKNIYIVSQETNLALPGFLGYLVNNLNIIPLRKSPNYIAHTFTPELKDKLDKGNFVLIYPEEEMWFNYRLPRPCKRGAYQFASKLNAPVIPFFTEIIDTDKSDNDEFNQVKYIIHVLDPIYPDPEKSDKENSIEMAKKDYEEKCEAYKKAYGKEVNYEDFSLNDIAGWKNKK